MKANTEKLILTKSGSVNKLWVNAIKNCRLCFTTRRIYPVRYIGGYRGHVTTADNSYYIEALLKAEGYKFKKGNDAPRGGKSGEYYQVSLTAFNFITGIK